MSVVLYTPRLPSTSLKEYQRSPSGPHWRVLRQAVRNCLVHAKCARPISTDDLGDEIVAGLSHLDDRERQVLRAVINIIRR